MKEQRAPSAGIDETTIIYKSKSPPNRKSEELASSINIGHNHERNTYKPRNNYNIKLNQGNQKYSLDMEAIRSKGKDSGTNWGLK